MNGLKDFWYTCKSLIWESPIHLAIPFSLILILLEKLTEMEFSCPCQPKMNSYLTLSIFSGPALLWFTVMVYISKPCKYCQSKLRFLRRLLPCLIPPCFWILMLLLDGQYLACGLSDWTGKYITDTTNPSMTWCHPINLQQDDRKATYQYNIGLSKVIGFSLLGVACIIAMIFICYLDCCIGTKEHRLAFGEGGRQAVSVGEVASLQATTQDEHKKTA